MRRLIQHLTALLLPGLLLCALPAQAGPYLIWKAGRFYMMENYAVWRQNRTAPDAPVPFGEGHLHPLQIGSYGDHSIPPHNCFIFYFQAVKPDMIFCENLAGGLFPGAIWQRAARKPQFHCVAGCTRDVPKILYEESDG